MAIDTIRRYSERPFEIRIIVSGLGLLNSKAQLLASPKTEISSRQEFPQCFAVVARAADFRDVPSSSLMMSALA